MAKTKKSKWVNRAELAKALGVSRSSIFRMEGDGMPSRRAVRGRPTMFNLAACRQWRASVDAVGAAGHSLAALRDRRSLAIAMEAEQRTLIRSGALIKAADAEAKLTEAFSRCRTKLLGLPRKLKALVPHITVEDVQILDDIIRKALTELSESHG